MRALEGKKLARMLCSWGDGFIISTYKYAFTGVLSKIKDKVIPKTI